MSENIPEELIADLRAGNLILWMGSGYSRGLGFPDWKEFVRKLGERYYAGRHG